MPHLANHPHHMGSVFLKRILEGNFAVAGGSVNGEGFWRLVVKLANVSAVSNKLISLLENYQKCHYLHYSQ